MKYAAIISVVAVSLAMSSALAAGQAVERDTESDAGQTTHLVEKGNVTVDGRAVAYLIRRLPVSSFPQLPAAIAEHLTQHGCSIPQTYQAHRPENVVCASLEQAGSSDWAVLCAARGTVSLLVFFASAPEKPAVLAMAEEKQRLQVHDLTGVMGFDWGIDPASPRQVREAQAAMAHRPPLLDHDALAETQINQRTVYHFFAKEGWTTLEMPE
jgi:hypothetical protein